MEGLHMEFPTIHDFAEHSRFALLNPKGYVQHVKKALRDGKGPREGNYFEDIYKRAARDIKRKEGEGFITVGTDRRIG